VATTLLNTGGSGDLAGHSCDSWQLGGYSCDSFTSPGDTESVTHVVPHSFLSTGILAGQPGPAVFTRLGTEGAAVREQSGSAWNDGMEISKQS